MRFLYCLLLLLLSNFIAFCQNSASDSKTIAAFDNYIQQALPLWKTPGISVAVVKDGKLVFKKAYGLREIGKTAPYTTATLSTCASTTKAMSAVCMGMLVDEGKVKWTDKVVDVLPGFKLYDPYATSEITVLDLFTHNTGLGNADLLWVYGYNREEIIKRMQFMPPAYSFRSDFIYQNLMYIVAGELIKQLSGKTWEAFITERLFTPLGMTNTFAAHSAITDKMNATTPHYADKDTVKAIPYIYDDNIGAAGGVWSCADDMAKWIQCILDSSKINGRRLLQPATYANIFKPQAMAPATMYPTMQIIQPHWFTYGLGWFQHDYKGMMVQMHTGSIAGLTAIAGLIPDQHFGIYIFGNLDHAELRHALMFKAFDLWCLNNNTRDWSAEFFKLYKGIKDSAQKKEDDAIAKRVLNTHPSLPLNDYTGDYSNKIFGKIKVNLQNNMLQIEAPHNNKLLLEHWQFDMFKGIPNYWWYGFNSARFILGDAGKIVGLNLGGVEYIKN